MRKMVLLAAMVALAALMLAAAPALADDNRNHDDKDRNHDNRNHDNRDFCDKYDCDFDGDFCDFFDCNDRHNDRFVHHDDFCDFFVDDFCGFDRDRDFSDFGDLDQNVDQEAESGDVDQSFVVTNTGDNSNQCVGTQGVANTGNAQNTINILNLGGEIDDFELEDLESSLTVSPTNTTTCDQEVNQAATAYGGGYYGGYYY